METHVFPNNGQISNLTFCVRNNFMCNWGLRLEAQNERWNKLYAICRFSISTFSKLNGIFSLDSFNFFLSTKHCPSHSAHSSIQSSLECLFSVNSFWDLNSFNFKWTDVQKMCGKDGRWMQKIARERKYDCFVYLKHLMFFNCCSIANIELIGTVKWYINSRFSIKKKLLVIFYLSKYLPMFEIVTQRWRL